MQHNVVRMSAQEKQNEFIKLSPQLCTHRSRHNSRSNKEPASLLCTMACKVQHQGSVPEQARVLAEARAQA